MKMKTLYRITVITLFLISSFAFTSCDNMEDIHADYIENGEIIYAAISDTLYSKPGNLRLQIANFIFNGESIDKCVIEWEDNKEQFRESFHVSLNRGIDSVLITLNNMKEQSYIFNIYNVDIYGNRSIKSQLSASVYGPTFESGLFNRPLNSIQGGESVDSLVFTWGATSENYVGTEVSYINIHGDIENKMLSSNDNRLVIREWKPESEMNYRSFYIPELNAIDTFSTDIDKVVLPALN